MRAWLARLLGYALVFGAALAAVLLVGRWTERAQLASLHERGETRLELYASVLEQELARYHYLPAAIALSPVVLRLLQDQDDPLVNRQVDQFLKELNEEAGASELYLLDRTGRVLAASNWDEEISFVGVDLSYRPYYQDALRLGMGRFYDIGTTSGEPGYYYARPIATAAGEIAGVAAVKVSLDRLQSPWQQDPNQAAIVADSDGVIILASEPGWKYRTLAALPPETLSRFQTTRQFENVSLDPLGLRTDRVLDPGARLVSVPYGDPGAYRRFLLQERLLPASDWRMIVLSDLESLRIMTRTAQAVAALGLGLALLLVLFMRQRRRVIRLERAAKRMLQQANLDLERKVAERTQELLDAQGKLVHASRLAALGQLAAVVAHELNQPLAALRTLSDNAATLLKRERLADAAGNLGMIGEIVDRMARISSQLKLFAAKPRGAVGPVSLAPCIEHALALLAPRLQAQGVGVDLELEGDPTVQADAGRLEQVLVNLLSNALDALRDHGDGRIRIVAHAEGSRVTIRVHDNGPGIPEELLPHLTEPFFTTKPIGSGLGLGLTISESIVREAGGTLQARNHPDGGAEFVVELQEATRASDRHA